MAGKNRRRGMTRRESRAIWWREQIELADTAEEQFDLAARWLRSVTSRTGGKARDAAFSQAARAVCEVARGLEASIYR